MYGGKILQHASKRSFFPHGLINSVKKTYIVIHVAYNI